MKQATHVFRIDTLGRGLVEFTDDVAGWLGREGFADRTADAVLPPHLGVAADSRKTPRPRCSIDMEAAFERPRARGGGTLRHYDEGPDDMPAHIRAALTGVNLSIPVIGGQMALGTWQGIFLFEHRRRPHRREVAAHVMGE